MRFIADFHIHSKYSRATSKDCVPEMLDLWGRKKGLDLIGTGDFTHPAWREELSEKLLPAEEGLYVLKEDYRAGGNSAYDSGCCRPRFILSAEISCIYKQDGKVRKVHNLILLPSIEAAGLLSNRLEQIGNLHSDGRPILGLSSRDLLEITLSVCPEAVFIPAHIWTPHFSLFGAYSGFDRIEDCFADLTPYIHSLETGLSSDPAMNRRLSALDRYTLISNSDAHSPSRLAREANLFHTELSYPAVSEALSNPLAGGFLGTLEFYPEEGKYHLDGHRNCKVRLTPAETREAGGVCPVCGRRITVGVLHRIESLSDRAEDYLHTDGTGFESLIPLPEAVAASLGMTAASKKVQAQYEELMHRLGSELFILREAPLSEVEKFSEPCTAEGIRRIRTGEVQWAPGYDGEYGKATLLTPDEIRFFSGQTSFFSVGENFPGVGDKTKAPVHQRKRAEAFSEIEQQVKKESGLSKAQEEAASAQGGAVAVIAGPGSGKTRTLLAHIRYLIEEKGVSPAEITAVTFTNKAASELSDRLLQELSDKRAARRVNAGTFHGICLRLLKKWRGEIAVLDRFESLIIAEAAAKETGLAKIPGNLLQTISRRKNGLPGEAVSDELLARYTAALSEYEALDYDDLLLDVLACFEAEEAQAEKEEKRFRYLLVDEFQDINDLQYRLLSAWGKNSRELFIIGDPDQAIYGFRGSDPQCFQRFFSAFPDCQRIRLDKNYRSTREILNCALPIIDRQPLPDKGDCRRLTAVRPSGGRVKLLSAESPFSEALYIVKEINRMVGGIDMLDSHLQTYVEGGSQGLSDIAVLYRTHRQAALLEDCFRKEGIPYAVMGRERYLDDKEVREALTFFKHLLYPQNRAAGRQTVLTLGNERLERLHTVFGGHDVRKERPLKLLDIWVSENDGSGAALTEKLRNAAVYHRTMPEFLQNLLLGEEGDLWRSGNRACRGDAVSLMTLHGSKGLEFPIVFLCGVNEDSLPLRGLEINRDVAEERRLLYVGMTRAKDQLILLTSKNPSPFLSDIPEEYLERGAVRTRPADEGKQLSLF